MHDGNIIVVIIVIVVLLVFLYFLLTSDFSIDLRDKWCLMPLPCLWVFYLVFWPLGFFFSYCYLVVSMKRIKIFHTKPKWCSGENVDCGHCYFLIDKAQCPYRKRNPMKRVKVLRIRSKWCVWAILFFLVFFVTFNLAWNNYPFLFPLAFCVFIIWLSLWIQTIFVEVLVNEPNIS